MFLLVGFDCLLPFHQFIVLSSCSLLFPTQSVAEDTNAILIMIQLSQGQLQAILVKVVHQCLVLLGLEKRDVGGAVNKWTGELKRK